MIPVWLVTGAGSGVGQAVATALASTGAEVILASRSRRRLEETAARCPGSAIAPVDLADPGSVDALGRAVQSHLEGRPLAGIVHAAGLMLWSSPGTSSGWSLVPLVNAIAPWRLTLALEASLVAGPPGRVLFVAGAPFTLRGVRPEPAQWRGERPAQGMGLALQAAAAKVTMARVLHRRWHGAASAFAFHPGFIRSHLAEGLPFPVNVLGCLAQPFLASRCLTGEFLALDPRAPELSGRLVSGRTAVDDPATGPGDDAWLSGLS